MAAVKTSILFFFLIIGTSVFPSGPSTGLANAEPWVNTALGIVGFVDQIMGRSKTNENGPSGPSFGSVTHQKDNIYHNENVSGSISYGSNTVQSGNQYPQYDK